MTQILRVSDFEMDDDMLKALIDKDTSGDMVSKYKM